MMTSMRTTVMTTMMTTLMTTVMTTAMAAMIPTMMITMMTPAMTVNDDGDTRKTMTISPHQTPSKALTRFAALVVNLPSTSCRQVKGTWLYLRLLSQIIIDCFLNVTMMMMIMMNIMMLNINMMIIIVLIMSIKVTFTCSSAPRLQWWLGT